MLSEQETNLVNATAAFANLQRALAGKVPLAAAIEALERSIIVACLLRHERQKEACAALGISRATLGLKARRYKISGRWRRHAATLKPELVAH